MMIPIGNSSQHSQVGLQIFTMVVNVVVMVVHSIYYDSNFNRLW